MAGFKAAAKPPTSLGAPKTPPSAKFDLGTRPTSLRGKAPGSPPKPVGGAAGNTRNYGVKTAPSVAIQPGNPMPSNQTGI